MSEIDEIKSILGDVKKSLSIALKPMLSLKEASVFSGISYRQLDEMCRQRKLTHYRQERKRFVTKSDLLEYMCRNKIQSKVSIEDEANAYILNH
ncbi:MAG: helix-turn-helix domain-containing protein [Lachnospira sp.]